ncbi:hypothetical protein F4803DRAFT_484887 [Xylaria telfairii]|nr:hypothetical protein F4803DRAFT_484887 [Xylaria telfairii]
MARKPSFIQFLIWTSSIPIAASRYVGLGGDITSLVPTCAQSCLESFITSNYPTIDCGTDFTLPCLCPVQSLSGLTVGEGALQCLFGYLQIGQCNEEDGDSAALARVLHMCSGQENALPNTHSTLTATLVIPPSGTPILVPPTSSKTTLSTSSTTTSARTTLSTTTSEAYFITVPNSPISTTTSEAYFITVPNSPITTTMVMTSFQTSTTRRLSSTSSSTTSSTASLTTSLTTSPSSSPTSIPASEPSTATRLAPAQIAGIAVGVAGAIAIAVGAIITARCLRRRRYPDADSERAILQNDNSTDGFDSFGSRTSHIFHISPPVLRTSRYRPDFNPNPSPPAPLAPAAPQTAQPEPPLQPSNIDRNTIGLAISRPRSLIPRKPSPRIYSPAMSTPGLVQVPLKRKPSKLLPPKPTLTLDIPSKAVTPGAPSSQAPLTKDRASTLTNMTAFADLDSEAAEGEQTWRPPPTDPLSATTLYVADKYGNWVLSNDHRRSQIAQVTEAAELDTYTPFTKSPVEKQEEVTKMAAAISASTALPSAPQPAFLSQDPTNWTYSQSSSLYSQASSSRQTGRRNSGRNSGSRPRKGTTALVMNRSDSKASATTIQTSTTGGKEDGFPYESDVARLSQLSPVKESPSPISGRSRVTYPKIHGRLDGATIRFVPPPKRPDFASSRFEQPSPTLGVVYPVEGSPSAYPLPLNPRRNERQLVPIQRTGSGFTPEPPEPPELPNVEVFPLQNHGRPNVVSSSRPYQRSDFVATPPAEPYRYMDSQQQDPFSTPSPQAVPTFTPSPLSAEKRPLTPPQPRIMDRGRPSVASQRVESGTSFQTVSSAASSLLTKRLGGDRAATFALDPNAKKAQKWRRQSNDGGLLSPDAILLGSPRGTLPQTPTWQPKLTPTRRGGDLYLNVQ